MFITCLDSPFGNTLYYPEIVFLNNLSGFGLLHDSLALW